jgi:cobalt/nickel transport system permease protein
LYKAGKDNFKPVYALITALAVLSPLGLLASGTAWGEWGNEELQAMVGYIPKGMEKGFSFDSIMPDNTIGNMPEVIAYLASVVIVVLLIFGIVRWTSKMSRS